MFVQFYCSAVPGNEILETVDLHVRDVQPFIELVEKNGYEDSDGERHNFIEAKVEYPKKVVIYLTGEDKE